jgi:peptide/nickel transport system substrate-binding protein
MRLQLLVRVIALSAVAGLVAVACGGAKTSSGSSASPTRGPTRGGSIVLGAEQWPECVNPITSCSSATWTWYSVLEQVLPYAMVLDLNGNFVASPLLTEAPTLDNGGITQNPFTITYHLNPTPIGPTGPPSPRPTSISRGGPS